MHKQTDAAEPCPPLDAAEMGGETGRSSPVVLTVEELALLLRVERKTAYAAIAKGEIPGVRRVGRSIRVLRDAVLHWLAQGQVRVPRSRRAP